MYCIYAESTEPNKNSGIIGFYSDLEIIKKIINHFLNKNETKEYSIEPHLYTHMGLKGIVIEITHYIIYIFLIKENATELHFFDYATNIDFDFFEFGNISLEKALKNAGCLIKNNSIKS